eukprot:scaffold3499_cov247-Pinguiococcus_pyrenoidosus.AAC.5
MSATARTSSLLRDAGGSEALAGFRGLPDSSSSIRSSSLSFALLAPPEFVRCGTAQQLRTPKQLRLRPRRAFGSGRTPQWKEGGPVARATQRVGQTHAPAQPGDGYCQRPSIG